MGEVGHCVLVGISVTGIKTYMDQERRSRLSQVPPRVGYPRYSHKQVWKIFRDDHEDPRLIAREE
jgi:hypothetical protein